MCLNKVLETYIPPLAEVRFGWKVFQYYEELDRLEFKFYRWKGSNEAPAGVWLTCLKSILVWTREGSQYYAGFHVYTTKEAAEAELSSPHYRNESLRQVAYTQVLYRGEQIWSTTLASTLDDKGALTLPVDVAQQIFIMPPTMQPGEVPPPPSLIGASG